MSLLDDGVPIRQMNILGTAGSYSTSCPSPFVSPDFFLKQTNNVSIQLNSGIRAFDITLNYTFSPSL
jgi:hypothetical protein